MKRHLKPSILRKNSNVFPSATSRRYVLQSILLLLYKRIQRYFELILYHPQDGVVEQIQLAALVVAVEDITNYLPDERYKHFGVLNASYRGLCPNHG